MEKNIYIIHENDEWLIPLRESFKKINAPFKEWHMDKESFDFKKNPPNGIFYNRMSASSHSRGHRYAPENTKDVLGWLEKDKKRVLREISLSEGPSVIFESGRRLEKLLDILLSELDGGCNILIAREMTKLHETLYRSTLANIKELIINSEYGLKGEFVVVIDSVVGIDDNNLSYNDKRIMDILEYSSYFRNKDSIRRFLI